DSAMAERPAHRPFVGAVDGGDESFRGSAVSAGRKKAQRKQGNHGEGKNEREKNGDAQGEAERRKEFADPALQQTEREKDDQRRGGGAHDGSQKLPGSFFRRFRRGFAQTEMTINVFDDDHGIVNDDSDGDGKAAERHQVARAVENLEEKEGADHRKRQGRGGHQGGAAVAQE